MKENKLCKAYRILGGNPIKGEINCIGSKNLTSQAMIAVVLGNSPTTFTNIPYIGDIELTAQLISSTGVEVFSDTKKNIMKIDPSNLNFSKVLPSKDENGNIKINRMPILVLGMLLNKFENVTVPNLGGCKIGERSIDMHLDILCKLGVEVTITEDYIIANRCGLLKSIDYELSFPSVGVTQNCLYLLIKAKGKSKLSNVAIEPEIIELINIMNLMGANININIERREIVIIGVEYLKGINYEIFGDRVEAASWACLACATDGDLIVNKIRRDCLEIFLKYFTEVGGGYEILEENRIRFFRTYHKLPINHLFLQSEVWPGFSTDWVQPFSILLSLAEGTSIVHETVFEDRLQFIKKLACLGIKSEIVNNCPGIKSCRYLDKEYPHTVTIQGPTIFKSDKNLIDILDLRAGFAFVIAAAIAEGETIITGVDKLERGYGDLAEKLQVLGMCIKKIDL